MKSSAIVSAALVAGILSASGAAVAQQQSAPRPDCPQPSASPRAGGAPAPQRMEGEVVRIDRKSNMVTVRANGQEHQFRGNEETLKDLKVGDKLEMKLRSGSGC